MYRSVISPSWIRNTISSSVDIVKIVLLRMNKPCNDQFLSAAEITFYPMEKIREELKNRRINLPLGT